MEKNGIKGRELIGFLAKYSIRVLFILIATFSLFIFTGPKVAHGRFSGIDNGIIDILMTFNLVVWTWVNFRLIPKNRIIFSILLICISSTGFLFTQDILRSHDRQFYNTFIMFNIVGVLLFIFHKLKANTLKAASLFILLILLILGLIVKPLGLFTGVKSEHDFVEVDIMYYDQEQKIIKWKRTKKGYDNIGERLEFHENGKLRFYTNYDAPEETPWVEYHENGAVRSINCFYYKIANSKKVKALYGVYFDDTGIPSQASSTYGQVLRYHYNGFVFLSGYSYNNAPYGKWYFYSYKNGSVIDSVNHLQKQPSNWDQRSDLKTNRYREKDSSIYKIRYDQKLMDGAVHYKPDSLYEYAISLKEKFDQNIEPVD